MKHTFSADQCLTFINCQLKSAPPGDNAHAAVGARTVTISRQTGSGAHEVARILAEYLQERVPGEKCRWTVFDRNLVEQVLEDHHLPQRMARFMPEDKVSELSDTMDELFGLHPASWTLVRQTSETILRLAELGNAIIIGRGANIITRNLDHVLHVRLVGSVECRAKWVEENEGLSTRDAQQRIRKEDRGRERYLKKYFDTDIHDPLLYDLVINTDDISHATAARLIGDAALTMKRKTIVEEALAEG